MPETHETPNKAIPEVKSTKPKKAPPRDLIPEGMKKVTADADLRVVGEHFVIIQIKANKPRILTEDLAFAAQASAAKAKVNVTIEG